MTECDGWWRRGHRSRRRGTRASIKLPDWPAATIRGPRWANDPWEVIKKGWWKWVSFFIWKKKHLQKNKRWACGRLRPGHKQGCTGKKITNTATLPFRKCQNLHPFIKKALYVCIGACALLYSDECGSWVVYKWAELSFKASSWNLRRRKSFKKKSFPCFKKLLCICVV